MIDLIEPLGSETLVHGHLAGGEEQSLTVKLGGPPPAGERLAVVPQPEHLHVFDEPRGGELTRSAKKLRAAACCCGHG